MTLRNTTPVPNEFFSILPHLNHHELKVLLLVIRQTYGWRDARTHERKIKDRMTYEFIIQKTGLYRSVLSETIQSLIDKGLLIVTDKRNALLCKAHQRKGKSFLFYQFQPVCNITLTNPVIQTEPIRNSSHNKRNTKNKSVQKEMLEQLQAIKETLAHHMTKNIKTL